MQLAVETIKAVFEATVKTEITALGWITQCHMDSFLPLIQAIVIATAIRQAMLNIIAQHSICQDRYHGLRRCRFQEVVGESDFSLKSKGRMFSLALDAFFALSMSSSEGLRVWLAVLSYSDVLCDLEPANSSSSFDPSLLKVNLPNSPVIESVVTCVSENRVEMVVQDWSQPTNRTDKGKEG